MLPLFNRFAREISARAEGPEQKDDRVTTDITTPALNANRGNRRAVAGWGFLIGICLSLLAIFLAPQFREWGFYWLPPVNISSSLGDDKTALKTIAAQEKKRAALERAFQRMTPAAPYLVVNSVGNNFHLKKGDQIIREGICSTGSYTLLKSPDRRQWVFQTPRGMFRVQNKLTSPVWRMPDWAFIEEGKPVPPPHAAERFERGVLGDYALSIGDGYLIHGTLYKRFLGLPVTHGCIRLDDEDLESVYRNLQPGSKVFIY